MLCREIEVSTPRNEIMFNQRLDFHRGEELEAQNFRISTVFRYLASGSDLRSWKKAPHLQVVLAVGASDSMFCSENVIE